MDKARTEGYVSTYSKTTMNCRIRMVAAHLEAKFGSY